MITGNRTIRRAGRQQASDRREVVSAGTSGLAWAAALTLAASLIVLTVALGYFDGTGLFAPENWVDAGLVPPMRAARRGRRSRSCPS